jgi:hypothetical protein
VGECYNNHHSPLFALESLAPLPVDVARTERQSDGLQDTTALRAKAKQFGQDRQLCCCHSARCMGALAKAVLQNDWWEKEKASTLKIHIITTLASGSCRENDHH